LTATSGPKNVLRLTQLETKLYLSEGDWKRKLILIDYENVGQAFEFNCNMFYFLR